MKYQNTRPDGSNYGDTRRSLLVRNLCEAVRRQGRVDENTGQGEVDLHYGYSKLGTRLVEAGVMDASGCGLLPNNLLV